MVRLSTPAKLPDAHWLGRTPFRVKCVMNLEEKQKEIVKDLYIIYKIVLIVNL